MNGMVNSVACSVTDSLKEQHVVPLWLLSLSLGTVLSDLHVFCHLH